MVFCGLIRFRTVAALSVLSLHLGSLGVAAVDASRLPAPASRTVTFKADVFPIFEEHCVTCHGPEKQKGGWRADVRETGLHGGDTYAPNILPGNSAESTLVQFVAQVHDDLTMPQKGAKLTPEEVGVLRAWIDQGAVWPEDSSAVVAAVEDPLDWWSLHALQRPSVPTVDAGPPSVVNPIDAFLRKTWSAKGLVGSPAADRRTLLRRLSFDLLGLPPSPEEIDAFVADPDPQAYEKRVDAYLASPRYGERWARHWLDVVHYGETHGYDKDKLRTNAWPYRDYVIRAFNEDKPYRRFVQEQIAGDVLFPYARDGIEALGFISAGPWDFIGHKEVAESKTDGKIARNLDRDDMVASTMNTFTSLTVQCARCHDHKFDRFVTQKDYYGMQAVFAALDRTDKTYDVDPAVGWQRNELTIERARLVAQIDAWYQSAAKTAGEPVAVIDTRLNELRAAQAEKTNFYGYQSPSASDAETEKWVQIDLGRRVTLKQVSVFPAQGDPRKAGDTYGFPIRFRVEASSHEAFDSDVTVIADETKADVSNPGVAPRDYPVTISTRYLRFTATRLAKVRETFLFALAEIMAYDAEGTNVALKASVKAPDLEDFLAPRWAFENLVDGSTPVKVPARQVQIVALAAEREALVEKAIDETQLKLIALARPRLAAVEAAIAALPPMSTVYAGAIHEGEAPFVGTGANGGKPREVHVLFRGEVNSPRAKVNPGAIPILPGRPAEFSLPRNASEGDRRAALARWLTDKANPLTWRSIVNRVWQYHFGRGIVDTPNDFGRMGQLPSHPELLDWLAVEFRDGGQSFKTLSRLIVTSAAYRQISTVTQESETALAIDADNRFLWKMNPRRLEAEAVRDTILWATGDLDLKMGGPSFQDFVIEQPQHSPHYRYSLFDPNDPASHRRSIYRLIVRSQPQPFLTALDCADPSLSVEKRNESIGALQALALMNNAFVIAMAKDFAVRLQKEVAAPSAQIRQAYRLALGRFPSASEQAEMVAYSTEHGLANACRIIMNLNEFAFVD